jgi:hypothetical protein
MSSDDKPRPPVPPSDSVRLAEHEKTVGSGTLDREPQETPCPQCGGTTAVVERQTGRVIIDMWDATEWDSDEYDLSAERNEIERYQACNRCGWRVYL